MLNRLLFQTHRIRLSLFSTWGGLLLWAWSAYIHADRMAHQIHFGDNFAFAAMLGLAIWLCKEFYVEITVDETRIFWQKAALFGWATWVILYLLSLPTGPEEYEWIFGWTLDRALPSLWFLEAVGVSMIYATYVIDTMVHRHMRRRSSFGRHGDRHSV